MGLDTACSSSLVAAHLARCALLQHECGTALSAGTNLMLLPGTSLRLAQLGALSSCGRSCTLDAAADGYGRGEGCTVLLMRAARSSSEAAHAPLAVLRGEALRSSSAPAILLTSRDGTSFYMLCGILCNAGSACNQDGRSSGLTAPNGPAQAALVRVALADAGAGPVHVGLISLHGTGTPLGDPIEASALGQALAGSHDSKDFWQSVVLGEIRVPQNVCRVALCHLATRANELRHWSFAASTKACIGHTEGAAGLHGTLLAMAALQRAAAPALLHCRTINPYVASALGEWRRAGGLKPSAPKVLLARP